MTIPYQPFWDWLLIDEEGIILGLRSDAPEPIWQQYKKYLLERENAKKRGIK